MDARGGRGRAASGGAGWRMKVYLALRRRRRVGGVTEDDGGSATSKP